jgi:hypothetical protein
LSSRVRNPASGAAEEAEARHLTERIVHRQRRCRAKFFAVEHIDAGGDVHERGLGAGRGHGDLRGGSGNQHYLHLRRIKDHVPGRKACSADSQRTHKGRSTEEEASCLVGDRGARRVCPGQLHPRSYDGGTGGINDLSFQTDSGREQPGRDQHP